MQHTKTLIITLVSSLCVLALSTSQSSDVSTTTDDQVLASRATVKNYMTQLKAALMEGMKNGGPVQAISTCNLIAPAINQQISAEQGWKVSRTSLKVRNPENTADDWERRVLLQFEQRKKAGEDIKTMEFSETIKDSSQFRYMKAIPTGTLCLKCHGSDLSPEIHTKLSELYPDDKATDFSAGDIRGAFSIIQPLQ